MRQAPRCQGARAPGEGGVGWGGVINQQQDAYWSKAESPVSKFHFIIVRTVADLLHPPPSLVLTCLRFVLISLNLSTGRLEALQPCDKSPVSCRRCHRGALTGIWFVSSLLRPRFLTNSFLGSDSAHFSNILYVGEAMCDNCASQNECCGQNCKLEPQTVYIQ